MSRILAEGLYHYAVDCGRHYRRLQDSVVGHQSTQWKMMEDYFRDINIGAGYERTKGYCRANSTTKCHSRSMSDNRDLTETFHQKISSHYKVIASAF